MSLDFFYKFLARRMPDLTLKLRQASMAESEVDFIRKTMFAGFMMSLCVLFIAVLVFSKVGIPPLIAFLAFPFLVAIMFMYFLKFPDMRIIRLRRAIDTEIVYAGRFLIIELESGIPIYDAFRHLSDNYPVVGAYFRNIVDDIDLGTTIDVALNRAVDLSPSQNLRRVLWQIMNSMTTGADIAPSLNAVMDQIVREQRIELNEYGRKLNPLAMFYLILAIILPSIGVTMFVILVSFLSIKLTLVSLLMIAAVMGFVQFMFYTVIKTSRPASQIED